MSIQSTESKGRTSKVLPFNKLNSVVEKGANLNLSGTKVPAFGVSSIPQLKKGKFEVIWHFGLLQPQISVSSSGDVRPLTYQTWTVQGFPQCVYIYHLHLHPPLSQGTRLKTDTI